MAWRDEKTAAAELVEAYERRWRKRRPPRGGGWGWWLLLLAAGAAGYFVLSPFRLDVGEAQEGSPLNAECLANYTSAASSFAVEEVALWRDAPREVKPRHAKAGALYYALVMGEAGGYDLYELTATGGGMTVRLLSPVVPPVAVDAAAFQDACKGRAFFVAHGGAVYAGGRATVEMARNLKKTLNLSSGLPH